MPRDLRVCFLGDSFVAGVGDPDHLGWTGRIAARSHRAGQPLTAYALGVRRQTSGEVLARWAGECGPRLPAGCDGRLVVSCGVNDATEEDGATRVPRERSAGNLAALLDGARQAGRPVLVVGPPPVADPAHAARTAALDAAFAAVCASSAVPYVPVLDALLVDGTWTDEVAAGDGAHPGAGGYARLADLVWPAWAAWIGADPDR